MAMDIAGLVFGGIFGIIFVVSCLFSVAKACKDRRKIKERIATRRAVAVPCVVTTSTSANSVERPRSASQVGDMGAPELFNYRRSSYGSNVIVRTIGEEGYEMYEARTHKPTAVYSDYVLNQRGADDRRHLNPISDSRYNQRRRSYEEAMANPDFHFPPKSERRLTEPSPRVHRMGRNFVARGDNSKSNHFEMNGVRGKENMAFDRKEDTHQF